MIEKKSVVEGSDRHIINSINVRIPGILESQYITIENGKISQIRSMNRLDCQSENTIDFAGDWVSLGGIDLQINGGLGLAFPDLTANDNDKLTEICQFLWEQGIDGFCPTIVTTSIEKIQRSLSFLNSFTPPKSAAQILGVHLEGPFLNPAKRGAHPAEYLLPLTLDNVKRVLGDYAHLVKIITLAPELDPTGEVIPYLTSLGIIVSLGHSQATAPQATEAFKQGATMVTHACNAMPPLHHREPGLLGAALVYPGVQCGVIVDGQHIDPTMLQILLRAGQGDRGLFLVSDALAPLGLPDGVYPWDEREIEVKQGTARLADGTLSGTTLPLLVGVQNLVKWGLCDVETAINLAVRSPRLAINIPDIAVGQPANLLRWHLDPATQALSWSRLDLLPNSSKIVFG
ncbi:N-acetylglucosamine-6-phosphate deacetylase [Merismopedia glauca]|uniref:N-acetylglucosamine-6-phosphate deacetylase n=1 Tax=Merismopedia glauca CCAP 1448/3 TaxID=1296344 RepID=A0A2T1CAK3_9CYAN|nr:N-acetylglucosamine-6-phosphate deacetylase [Merismopedia glauca]PSB05292.1 N-acetylglucosamine-6-phosphate deacetylase [Merismopedia glauca CCAP 1448/3]